MPQLIVVFWRDIPAQVIVKKGRKSAKRPLDERFEKAIDRAAMRAGMAGTDDYLSEWRRAPMGDCGDDLEAEAVRAAQELEHTYDEDTLRDIVLNKGHAPESATKES